MFRLEIKNCIDDANINRESKADLKHDHFDLLISMYTGSNFTWYPTLLESVKKQVLNTIFNQNRDAVNKYKYECAKLNCKVKFGHHIWDAMKVGFDKRSDNGYAMVGVMFENKDKIPDGDKERFEFNEYEVFLDISGGKRRIGEDSRTCAFRETEEETSVEEDYITKRKI